MPVIPPYKGTEKINKKKDAVENKADVRPNSILRPRAVLSSPDNDGMVKSKNKSRPEQHSGLKNHNSCQNRHVQCKVIPRPVPFGSPVNTKKQSRRSLLPNMVVQEQSAQLQQIEQERNNLFNSCIPLQFDIEECQLIGRTTLFSMSLSLTMDPC